MKMVKEKTKEIITSQKEMTDHVLTEYRNESVELNSLFFDFEIKMKKADILEAYKELQRIINGDNVIRLVDGKEADEFIKEGSYTDLYEGNCKDFLESFNDMGEFARFTDDEELDFIF